MVVYEMICATIYGIPQRSLHNRRRYLQSAPSLSMAAFDTQPGRNYDYARWNSSAILDLDADVRFAVGDESRALGDEDLCAELLCLVGPNLTKYSHFVLLSQQDKN